MHTPNWVYIVSSTGKMVAQHMHTPKMVYIVVGRSYVKWLLSICYKLDHFLTAFLSCIDLCLVYDNLYREKVNHIGVEFMYDP